MKSIIVCLFVLAVIVQCCVATTSKQDALVTGLPGLDYTPPFKQYAGYITVDESHGRNLFYWFVESQNDPANDPVVLWLQGGPGCSSIGAGMLQENGPFLNEIKNITTKEIGLREQPWAWNKVANVIYLDSPAGVGYSYSETLSDYDTNDNKTAADSTKFLEIFFGDVFTEFASNTFWMTGESYAGVYLPTLAYSILTTSTSPQLIANFKRGGMMLGNPVTDCSGAKFGGEDDILFMNTNVQSFYYHAMVSPRLYTEWLANSCDTSSPKDFAACRTIYAKVNRGTGPFHQPLKRRNALKVDFDDSNELFKVNSAGTLNPDDLYYSFCTGNATLSNVQDHIPECYNVDDQSSAWLNNDAVQQALHARPGTSWSACSNKLIYHRTSGSLIPYLENIFNLAPTARILYYAGDVDINTVPFSSTFRCLETMQLPVVEEWQPWGFSLGANVNNEIAGYVEVYSNITLATVKGAGHEAPAFQPAIAYQMYTSFLANKPLPGTKNSKL